MYDDKFSYLFSLKQIIEQLCNTYYMKDFLQSYQLAVMTCFQHSTGIADLLTKAQMMRSLDHIISYLPLEYPKASLGCRFSHKRNGPDILLSLHSLLIVSRIAICSWPVPKLILKKVKK